MYQPRIPIGNAFDWTEYLNLAGELSKDTTFQSARDARLRSAISRAYYAAFHKARITVLPPRVAAWGSHQQIIDMLQESEDPARRQLGVDLARLKGNRRKADYDDIVVNMSALVEDSLIGAQELIEAFNVL